MTLREPWPQSAAARIIKRPDMAPPLAAAQLTSAAGSMNSVHEALRERRRQEGSFASTTPIGQSESGPSLARRSATPPQLCRFSCVRQTQSRTLARLVSECDHPLQPDRPEKARADDDEHSGFFMQFHALSSRWRISFGAPPPVARVGTATPLAARDRARSCTRPAAVSWLGARRCRWTGCG